MPDIFLKRMVKQAFGLFGLEIRRKPFHPPKQPCGLPSRASMTGCLQQALQNGLNPRTVIDVGAASGTSALYELFPDAYHILIEPLEEFLPALKQLTAQLRHADYIHAAAASTSGDITINVHPDLVGSSLYKEHEDSDVNGVERTVQGITLDDVCREQDAHGPYLLKIDAQGAELDVLQGAGQILQHTEFIILEVSLFEFFQGGPQLYDCILFMKECGFVPYDVFGLQYRLLDGAMSQLDMALVQEKGRFRACHYYATKEQRDAQNIRIRQALST